MLPLTQDDLLPLQEYATRRKELFDSFGRYLDRYRRVRIGPKVTLLFENRQTLWFRVHEIFRIARLADTGRVQDELDWYNTLLPGRDNLQAGMLIDVQDETRLIEELAPWNGFTGEQLRLCIGNHTIPASLTTCRPEDLCIGAAHWVQFSFDRAARQYFHNFRLPALLEIRLPDYLHQSATLSDDIRQSLLDDLNLSDRDDE
jgi:hypothetical protein